jgi:NitT/TauT family transport system substrate-binding protein
MRLSGHRPALAGALLAASLAASLAAGCGGTDSSGDGGPERRTLTVAALPLVDDAAVHIAQKQGLFEAEGLNVRIRPVQQSIQALPALAKGDIDLIAGANYVTFLQAHEKGTLRLRIVAEAATLTPNLMNVLVAKDSPIRTAKDLEGRKVAVNILNNIQGLTLDAILQAGGVDPSGIGYTAVPFPQMGAALQKGQVDAVHVVEPFLTDIRRKLGARVVVNGGGRPVTDLPISGYVSTQAFVTENPKSAAAFQRAILKAQRAAAGDRKRVEEVLPGYARIDREVAAAMTLPGYPTTLDAARLQRVADLMVSAGLLKQKPDVRTLLLRPPS